MIIRILFKADGEPLTMLTGSSYKNWKEQYDEMYRLLMREYNGNIEPVAAWKSWASWVGWGGLKWCSEKNFQNILNREGRQAEEEDKPTPRLYSKMKFVEMPLSKLN
jgi:hypothetical protein